MKVDMDRALLCGCSVALTGDGRTGGSVTFEWCPKHDALHGSPLCDCAVCQAKDRGEDTETLRILHATRAIYDHQ